MYEHYIYQYNCMFQGTLRIYQHSFAPNLILPSCIHLLKTELILVLEIFIMILGPLGTRLVFCYSLVIICCSLSRPELTSDVFFFQN